MVYVIYIAAGIILLGLCIFVHELGHLLGGKMVGIKAKTFSIGYGRGILKKTIGGTTYQLAPIPFGGFCQFYGEDPSEERTGQQYEFLTAHPARRIFTVAMGPIFNLIFGIVIFFAMNLVGYSKDTNRVHIPENLRTGAKASPAAAGGIVSGDRIVMIGDKEIHSFPDIVSTVLFSDGKKLDITVIRDGARARFTVAPRRQESGRYEIGVAPYGSRILIVEVIEGGAAMEAFRGTRYSVESKTRSDGGDVELVGIEKDGVVKVRLKGACGGCPMSQLTLKMGIERILKKEVPEVKEVVSL